MAKLYEINQESAHGEITYSLAQSLKKSLFTPTEKKINALESHLGKEYEQLKKMFYLSIALSIISLVSVVTIFIFLYNWYS